MIWTRAFWMGATERAVKTVAQALVAVVGVAGIGILDVNWGSALSVAAAAGLASLLTSIGSADFVAGHQPEPLPEHGDA
ncbi:holin [Arachnia propionica]|uniref:Holin n=1 Tax=Arachnia propionica TaxID=1750 RepID=A0A3P1T1J5_9ACTN|nr:holin [Arachnia propionica]RRD03239.1 holin [Arachnia propionica]